MTKHLLSTLAVLGSILWAGLSADPALAERRVALVIGNSQYKNPSLILSNPKNDADDVAQLLRSLQFEVVQTTDAAKRDLEFALQKFARLATDADSALFFYAGHAMQYQGRNYLMPVDAELEDEISLRYQMIALDDVRSALDRANGVKIMILDSCRNNPLAERLIKTISGSTRAASTTRGLARIDKTQGMVVAYATAADEVAMDGSGRNSPFTTALLKRLQEPGLEIEMMFRRIAMDVNSHTGGRQRPETYISLLSEYYLNQSDRLVWDRIKDAGDPAALRDFIARFPSSIRALDAKYRLEVLERFAQEREAERQKAEREARDRREAEERARLAEADRQRKEREAAEQRLAERTKIAEAERQREEKEAAERRQAQEQARIAEAERLRKELEAAEQRLAEQGVKIGEIERQRQEREAAARREEEERAKVAAAERERTERQAAERREAEERTKLAAAERARQEREAAERRPVEEHPKVAAVEPQRPDREAAERREAEERAKLAELTRQRTEQACKQENERLALLQAAGNGAREEMTRFERELSCERLRPMVLAALGKMTETTPKEKVAPPVDAAAVNTKQLVSAAQAELRRLGCYSGRDDGRLDDTTQKAIKRYLSRRELPATDKVTEGLVADLKGVARRVCPLECQAGQIAKGDRCIAEPKPEKSRPQHARRPAEDDSPPPRQRPRIEPRVAAPRPAAAPAPQPAVRAEASRPAAKMLGVGF